jgi:hypothetical protein
MIGTVPEAIGELVLLEKLCLGYQTNSNEIVGPLPSSMSNLVHLTSLSINVATLSGPVPDLSRLISLDKCRITPSLLCRVPQFIPVNSNCDLSILEECASNPDCAILAEWLPIMFDSYTCCQVDGVSCEADRVVILDLSLEMSNTKIEGAIPFSIGELDLLQQLYLQDNSINGTLPISMANITSLQIVDVSNNFLSGPLKFLPSFELIGFLSLPDLSSNNSSDSNSTQTDSTTFTIAVSQEITSSGSESSKAALLLKLAIAGLLFLLLFIAIAILLKRRKQGKESLIELRLLPKYSSKNKKIRLLSKINSGGFGVVWKARYKGETVAIKLIRMDKYEGKKYSNETNVKIFKMVVEEASIMELMVHKRIVKFIMFEIESLGIVLEYLQLGSLYDYIQKSKGNYPWTDRYQMMLDICEGMEFLHSKVYANGSKKQVLFHQDLKSGNVLLVMEGSPSTLRGKISDFGLSCKFITALIIESSFER